MRLYYSRRSRIDPDPWFDDIFLYVDVVQKRPRPHRARGSPPALPVHRETVGPALAEFPQAERKSSVVPVDRAGQAPPLDVVPLPVVVNLFTRMAFGGRPSAYPSARAVPHLSGTNPRNFSIGSILGCPPIHSEYIFPGSSVFPRERIICLTRSPLARVNPP